MIDLAMNSDGKPVSLKDVAQRQEISDKYLEQIIAVFVERRADICSAKSRKSIR